MLVYFDSCALNRPLDAKIQPRVLAEAAAVEALLFHCLMGQLQLLASDVLYYEAMCCADLEKQAFVYQVLAHAVKNVAWSRQLAARTRHFEKQGLKPLDSLHLASAEAGLADWFCTCDTRLLRRARKLVGFTAKLVTPAELLKEI